MKYSWVEKGPGGHYELSFGVLPVLFKLQKHSYGLGHAQEILNGLSNETGLSCKLSIRQGNEQLTLIRAEAPGPFAVTGKIGARFPLIEGSVGAALAAQYTDQEIQELLDLCPQDDLPEKKDPKILWDAVGQVRKNGVAVNLQQNRWHICAMSSPVQLPGGETAAALTLIGFEKDFSQPKRSRLKKSLENACTKL